MTQKCTYFFVFNYTLSSYNYLILPFRLLSNTLLSLSIPYELSRLLNYTPWSYECLICHSDWYEIPFSVSVIQNGKKYPFSLSFVQVVKKYLSLSSTLRLPRNTLLSLPHSHYQEIPFSLVLIQTAKKYPSLSPSDCREIPFSLSLSLPLPLSWFSWDFKSECCEISCDCV